jgi:DNA/RNA endonuclease G (NUC1)
MLLFAHMGVVVPGCAARATGDGTVEPFNVVGARRPALASVWRADQARSAEDQARVDDNCGPLGEPEVGRRAAPLIGPTVEVCRDGYVLMHSSVDKIPLWVCERIEPGELSGAARRRDVFAPDPLLGSGARAELIDYRGSGYDRGHMAPAGNQARVQRLKDETFYLSNMVPQEPRFNQGIWAGLEETIRGWGERGDLYTITGPMFWDPSEDDTASADGVVEYWVIGPDQVAVPTHTYKIVARQGPGGQWECVAFVMENINDHPRPYDFESFIVSVSDIERRTGLNFFPRLPADQTAIEAAPGTMFP